MINSMTIQNVKYVLSSITNENGSISCIADGEQWSVPLDPANRHYAEILKQVAAGTLTIAAAD